MFYITTEEELKREINKDREILEIEKRMQEGGINSEYI